MRKHRCVAILTALVFLFSSVALLPGQNDEKQENEDGGMTAEKLIDQLIDKRDKTKDIHVKASENWDIKDQDQSFTFEFSGKMNLPDEKLNFKLSRDGNVSSQTVSDGNAVWELKTNRRTRKLEWEKANLTKLYRHALFNQQAAGFHPFELLMFGRFSKIAPGGTLEVLKKKDLELTEEENQYTLKGSYSTDRTDIDFSVTVKKDSLKPVSREGSFDITTRRGKTTVNFDTTYKTVNQNPSFDEKTFNFTPPEDASETSSPKKLLGKKMEGLKMDNIKSGETTSLSDYEGKVILLNVWRTWCPPCKKEIPDLIKLHNKYKDQGFSVVGTANDQKESKKDVTNYMEKKEIPYPVLDEKTGSKPEIYNELRGVPTSFIIDREGTVQYIITGARDFEQFEEFVSLLLDQEPKKDNEEDNKEGAKK